MGEEGWRCGGVSEEGSEIKNGAEQASGANPTGLSSGAPQKNFKKW